MIQRKKRNCILCGELEFIFSKNRCKRCSNLDYKAKANRKPKGRLKKTPTTAKIPMKKRVKKKPTGRPRQTISKLKTTTRYWFQRWIRLTRINVPCAYGCGKFLNDIKSCDAGHYLKAELYPQATFDKDNVWPVCKGCNIRDPLLEYRKNLIKIHGEDWVNKLENKYKLNRGHFKWDRLDLEEIRDKYKKLCKEIERNFPV